MNSFYLLPPTFWLFCFVCSFPKAIATPDPWWKLWFTWMFSTSPSSVSFSTALKMKSFTFLFFFHSRSWLLLLLTLGFLILFGRLRKVLRFLFLYLVKRGFLDKGFQTVLGTVNYRKWLDTPAGLFLSLALPLLCLSFSWSFNALPVHWGVVFSFNRYRAIRFLFCFDLLHHDKVFGLLL